MGYPYVQAAYDYGPRNALVHGFVIHMAEGGGTVGYLSRSPARGVSVHFVIEYSGKIIQMLPESHVSGSINPADIRKTDDPDGFYGRTAAVGVLGSWADDPNVVVLTVEIEGFAVDGPNDAQVIALQALTTDLRSRYPGLGNLGHRDFADYKPCPGRKIPWALIGGHGHMEDHDVTPAPITDQTPMEVRLPAGANIFDVDGKTILRTSPGSPSWRTSPYEQGGKRAIFSPDPPIVLVAVGSNDKRLPTPVVSCDDVVQSELDKAADRAALAVRTRP